ncbi:alpha/beta hydrolase [Streptomyces sp. MS2.AVA.5]|uniref:Alpha/beta hydrolase-fold protein n=1 Tax=Streptomyces achmelvichensis TaxID=3134111 RepID=A0ACC6Q8H7_9ACTN
MTHSSLGPSKARGRRWASRARISLISAAAVVTLALVAWPVMSYYEIPPFTDKGAPVSYDQAGGGVDRKAAGSRTLLPTGPKADFKNVKTLSDGSQVSVVALEGEKSGFKGKVWVWAPKEYKGDPKFTSSGFPVMIALPGGPGHDSNYWSVGEFGPDKVSLEESISKWYQEGKSKPFLLAMPILNPGPDDKGIYWDASDIPDQPKMGTWLTEDVPSLMKANFRTLKSRDGWSYMGSSTGGFASLKSVLKHPDKFKTAIANGPDILPDSPLWRGHEREKQENNPEELAKQLKAAKGPDVYIAFQVGTKEHAATIDGIKRFMATYGTGPVHTKLWEIPGGTHNGATYLKNMEAPMQWISEQMEGPVPSS